MHGKQPVDTYTLAFAGVRVLDSNDSAVNYSVLLQSSSTNGNWGNHSSPETTSDWRTGPLQLTGSVVLGLLLSLFVVFALAGNLLVIVAITTDRHLRQSGNYFLVSLAIADMLVAVAVMTFAMVNDILGRWVFGPVLCNLWMSADVMCSTASILSLCSVSLDRYVHIRNPLHYERWVTARRALVAIAIIWALSAFISFLPIHLGWHRLHENPPTVNRQKEDAGDTTTAIQPIQTLTEVPEPQSHCVLELNPLYAVLSSTISFYVPCIAMTVIYFQMHSYARRHAESIKRAYSNCPHAAAALAKTPSSTLHTPTTGYSPGSRETSSTRSFRRASLSSRAHRKSDHKAAITLGIIMGVFLVCWVPFFTINVFGAFCRDCIPPIVFTVFTWLGYVNSTMNPVIYSIFNRQFREAFKRVLVSAPGCCCCCRHPMNKSPKNGADYFQAHRRQRCSASGALYFSAAANDDDPLANHNGTGTALNGNRNMQL